MWVLTMKKKKPSLIDLTKETPELRKKRVSTGGKFRAVVFKDRRRKLKEKYTEKE